MYTLSKVTWSLIIALSRWTGSIGTRIGIVSGNHLGYGWMRTNRMPYLVPRKFRSAALNVAPHGQ